MNLLIQHSDHDVTGAGSDPLQRGFALKGSWLIMDFHAKPLEIIG